MGRSIADIANDEHNHTAEAKQVVAFGVTSGGVYVPLLVDADGKITLDSTVYAKLDGSNQPFTGNIQISKASPQFQMYDSSTAYYATHLMSGSNYIITFGDGELVSNSITITTNSMTFSYANLQSAILSGRQFQFYEGIAGGSLGSYTVKAMDAIGGSNLNGGGLILSGGNSTGSGTGPIYIYASGGGGSGSSTQAAALVATWTRDTLTLVDGYNIAVNATTGTKIGTSSTQKIGFWNATPVVQPTNGANLTNNVTSGGSNDTIANYTDLVIYANDAAAIRNNIYQLARKLKIVNDALRTMGLMS